MYVKSSKEMITNKFIVSSCYRKIMIDLQESSVIWKYCIYVLCIVLYLLLCIVFIVCIYMSLYISLMNAIYVPELIFDFVWCA